MSCPLVCLVLNTWHIDSVWYRLLNKLDEISGTMIKDKLLVIMTVPKWNWKKNSFFPPIKFLLALCWVGV